MRRKNTLSKKYFFDRNVQPMPGYNIQAGTENNFVIGYDIFPNPNDTRTFKTHMKNIQRRLGCKFKAAIADCGYGSEENYEYLEEHGITPIIKYATYEQEKKKKLRKKIQQRELIFQRRRKVLHVSRRQSPNIQEHGDEKKCFRLRAEKRCLQMR